MSYIYTILYTFSARIINLAHIGIHHRRIIDGPHDYKHTHTHTQVYRSFPRPLDLRRICLVNNVTVARLCVQMARVYYIYINMIIKRYLCKITRIRLACAPRDEVPEPSR